MDEEKLSRVYMLTASPSLFLQSSVKSAFEVDDTEVKILSYSTHDVSEMTVDKDIVIMFSEEFDDTNRFSLTSIKKFLALNNIKVIILGDVSKNEYVSRNIPSSYIWEQIARPIDVKEVVEKTKYYNKIFSYQKIRKNILVVDDSPIMLRTVKNWFEKDYNVQVANSAQLAMAQIKKQLPDIMLLDYEMPGCSGAEFLKILREDGNTESLPVMFLTSKNSSTVVNEVIGLKPVGYMLKNLPGEQIVEKVNLYFASKALEKFN